MMNHILVTGIGTDVGKTLVSAILVKALNAHYWKPIQSGNLDASDAQRVKELVPEAVCYPEAFRLCHPLSPHHAAQLEGVKLEESAFRLPTRYPLVIETCGGILVPYQTDRLLIDLYLKWNCEWIVVSRHYLGSINHTLLTLDALQRRGVRVKGIIFNGTHQFATENAILSCSNIAYLGHLYPEKKWTSDTIKRYCDLWKI